MDAKDRFTMIYNQQRRKAWFGFKRKRLDKPSFEVADPLRNKKKILQVPAINNNLNICIETEEGKELFDAITNGDVIKVETLIKQNPECVRIRAKDRSTPLHIAALANNVDILKLLIANGADLNALNSLNSTALHCAASKGCRHAVNFLVECGLDKNARDTFGYSPFHLCIRTENLEIAEDFKDMGVDINFKQFGKTALHMACELCLPKAVEWLLLNNSSVNLKDQRGRTPLFYAIRYPVQDERVKKIIQLLASNSNCSFIMKNDDGKTILHEIVEMEHADMFDLILEYRRDDVIRSLLNDTDKSKQTPLHYAVAVGSFVMVSKLLYHKCDPNFQDKDGNTALHMAIEKKQWNLVREIGGCERTNFNIKNKQNKTAKQLLKAENKKVYKEIKLINKNIM